MIQLLETKERLGVEKNGAKSEVCPHTGRVTVHAEAVPSHVPYGLNGHGVALAAQPRL